MPSKEYVPEDNAKSEHHYGEGKHLPDRVEHSDDCDRGAVLPSAIAAPFEAQGAAPGRRPSTRPACRTSFVAASQT
jgi:hypothetical protein